MKKYLLILSIVIIAILIFLGIYLSRSNNPLQGHVEPSEPGIKVTAIKDRLLVQETMTDANGDFSFDSLGQGNYGLLFTYKGHVYIYNDATNTQWISELPNGANLFIIKENLNGKFPTNVDLTREKPDYLANQIIVQIKSTTSDEEIELMMESCPCTIVEKVIKPYGHFYVINFSDEATLFDMNAHFLYFENYVVTSVPNSYISGNRTFLEEVKNPTINS